MSNAGDDGYESGHSSQVEGGNADGYESGHTWSKVRCHDNQPRRNIQLCP